MKPRPFHHQRPLAAAGLAYGLGVWAGVSFAWFWWMWLAGFVCAGALSILLPRQTRGKTECALAAALFLGMLLGGGASHPAVPDAGRYQVSGVVESDVKLRENGTAAGYLVHVRLTGEGGGASLDKAYWTYTPDEEDPFLPREGDEVTFEGRLYHPQGQMNPYGFDFRMYLLEKGVAAGISGASQAQVTGHPGRGLASLLYGLRQGLLARVRAVFGPDSALPEALLLGWRDSLPQETQKGFAQVGVAHLLALSGLHVGLLAGVILIALKHLLRPGGRLAVMAGFLLIYCALLGFPAPVARASILLLLTLYRRTVRRAPDALTTLCAAFLLILLFRPLDLFTASFQLSFAAVLGIVALGPQLTKGLSRVRPRFLREGWVTTFSATAGAILPTVQIFHRFSLLGLAVNPFLCALFGVLLPLYALAAAVGCVSLNAGQWLAQWLNPVTRGVIYAVEWLGSLPFASLRLPTLPWYCVAAFAAAFALATRYCLGSRKAKALAAAGLLAVSLGAWRLTLCRDVQYIQLSMGQADAALILDGRETVVIDAGDYGGDVASYLLSTGRQADRVILTHLHSDHCLGLTALLEEEIPIGAVYLPEGAQDQQIDDQCRLLMDTLREKDIPVLSLAAGDRIILPRVSITVTWPWPGAVRPGQDPNRYSLCALCDLDGVKLLTTGDLTGEYEIYAAADADILKVAHHGSKSSTGQAFLQAVTPGLALISANAPGGALPHQDTLARLEEAGCSAYTTGSFGALTLTARNGEAILKPYLSKEVGE